MTKRNMKYTAGFIILIALFVGSQYLKYHEDVIVAPVLKDNEKQKIIVDTKNKTVTTVTRNSKQQVVKVKDGVRKVVVVEDNDGNIHVTTIDKGLCFEPGLALYYSEQARLGLDVQVAYWRQWGVLLGAGVNMGDEPRTVRMHIAVSHALPLNFIENTTVFLGVDQHKDAVLGLRIKF